jgi:hypothetical protein
MTERRETNLQRQSIGKNVSKTRSLAVSKRAAPTSEVIRETGELGFVRPELSSVFGASSPE